MIWQCARSKCHRRSPRFQAYLDNDGNADCRGVIKVNCNGTQWNPNSIRPKVAETSKFQIHKYKNTKYQEKLKNRNIQRLQCKLRCDKSQLNRSHSVVNIFVHKNSDTVYHGFWGILNRDGHADAEDADSCRIIYKANKHIIRGCGCDADDAHRQKLPHGHP